MPDPTTATSAVSLRSRAGAAATVTSIHSERVRSCATFMVASCRLAFTGSAPMTGRVAPMRGAAAGLPATEALAQRIHQVDDVVGLLGRRGGLDLLAGRLAQGPVAIIGQSGGIAMAIKRTLEERGVDSGSAI